MVSPTDSPELRCIYLDTTILKRFTWPSIPHELMWLLDLARLNAVPVALPTVVELERKRQWVGERLKEWQGLLQQRGVVANSAKKWGMQEPHISNAPDKEYLEAHFDVLSEALKNHWAITTVTVPDVPLAEVVELAIRRRGAFQKKEPGVIGFNDTVILLSVLHDMSAKSLQCAALVSADGVFDTENVRLMCQQRGVTLQVCDDLGDLTSSLRTRVDPERRWAGDMLEARTLLVSHQNALEALLIREVSGLELERIDELRMPEGKVRQVEIRNIGNVQTPNPSGRLAGVVTITCDIEVEVEIEEVTLHRNAANEVTGRHLLGRAVGLIARAEIAAKWDQGYTTFEPKQFLRDLSIVSADIYDWKFKRQIGSIVNGQDASCNGSLTRSVP